MPSSCAASTSRRSSRLENEGGAAPTLAAIVRERTGLPWSRARKLCEEGRVTVNGETCRDPAMRVDPGAAVVIHAEAPKAPRGPLAREAIVFFDRDVVVVGKPPGMLSVADERTPHDSLDQHVRTLLRRIDRAGTDTKLGIVHRLDKETSGVMMFARNATAHRMLATAFRAHDIERVYEAIVHGRLHARTIETELVRDRGDGLRGSQGAYRHAQGTTRSDTRRAVTHVAPLETFANATLVECRLETGRQHQIRIHLAELGHPLLGENVYIRDYGGPRISAPRVMLHARKLGFVHPRTGKPMSFEREPPADFQEMIDSLRR